MEADKRPKVLVTHWDVPEEVINLLKSECDVTIIDSKVPTRKEILEKSKGVDGIFWATSDDLDAEAFDAAGSNLKAVSTYTVGFDYVDVEEAKKRKIPLGHTPGVLNDSVADMAIGLLIAAARRFHESRLLIENNMWEQRPRWMMGQEIRGSTVGIVGFGRIGEVIARRLQSFEIGELLYTGRSEKPYAKVYEAHYVELDTLLERSDFVIVIAPLTDETKNMFNEAAFKKMKPTSVFVNVARGELVDQNDLVKALTDGTIFSAGLDVMSPEPLPYDHPLLKLPNCVITPHLGSSTHKTILDMAMIAGQNVINGIFGRPMVASIY